MATDTIAYTAMPEPNQTYLVQTKTTMVPTEPLSGSAMAFMMVLSAFQYQAPPVNPTYANALSQASQKAFTQSGAQEFQNKVVSYGTKNGLDFMHSVGISDIEMGAAIFTFRTVQRKQLNLNSPKVYGVKANLSLGYDNANLGLKYEF